MKDRKRKYSTRTGACEMSSKLGFNKNWFSIIKATNREYYDFLLSFDSDQNTSVMKAFQEYDRLESELIELIYEKDDLREFSEYFINKNKGLYSTKYTFEKYVMSNRTKKMMLKNYKKLQKVIFEYRCFREKNK